MLQGLPSPPVSRILARLLIFLCLSALYLYAFPQPTIFYAVIVFLHAAVGVAAAIVLAGFLYSSARRRQILSQPGWWLLAAGTVLGLTLIKTGTARAHWNLMYWHISLSAVGTGIIFADRTQRWAWRPFAILRRFAFLLAFGALAFGTYYVRESRWKHRARIENPPMAPESMESEGDGPGGPFFPSSAQVYGGQKIPSKFFMESDACKRCHEDVYNQWSSSAHHFSSFNNQWYRKSIEYMQDTVGTQPSKWCGGCHDPAVLYSGLMDTPIKEIVHRPESQAGLGCMMCHSIAHVKSTMGQADFYLEYPTLHELAASQNPVVRGLHDFLIELNPEPHRRVFLKPFMRAQNAEFCSSCHKVHLDVPVNHYRWIRGFNEYDSWQASGVSGQGARSFYYPEKPSQCADCHMPLIRSNDFGNVNGFVHSHRFPGANTALPTANQDGEQLKLTEDFLKNDILGVDIFALSPDAGEPKTQAVTPAELSTNFAVGEEAEARVEPAEKGETAQVTAPLNRVHGVVRRGDTVRVDVVVRTRKIGHFFPGGTVDAYDTWLELKGTDDKGQTIFWSGMVENAGHGPVEKGAHFYRSLQLDAHGNRINKRNAWATRAVVYVRLIPPGAADTVHYRVHIPEGAGNSIRLRARLCYRKFAWWNTQFSFAGEAARKGEVSADYDDRSFVFSAPLKGVSAKEEKIPDLPIISVAENEVTLAVAPSNLPPPAAASLPRPEDWQRWNDYGIGLLLQGDLKGAEAAFRTVTEIAPSNADGWVNIGRAAVQEGDMEQARTALEKALSLSPKLARAHFFYAKVLRNEGRYDDAVGHLREVVAQYPRDRVALNDLGRILFLQHRYPEAIATLKQVVAVDPEDLQAQYNLMLSYSGLGDKQRAREYEVRYLRFKADEASQAITGDFRQRNVEDNNERQAIHEHLTVPLPGIGKTQARRSHRMPATSAGAAASGGRN